MGRANGIPKSVLLATRVTPGINEKVKQIAFREGYVRLGVDQTINNSRTKEPKHAGKANTSTLKCQYQPKRIKILNNLCARL